MSTACIPKTKDAQTAVLLPSFSKKCGGIGNPGENKNAGCIDLAEAGATENIPQPMQKLTQVRQLNNFPTFFGLHF